MEHDCLILISGALQCISHPFRSLAVPYLTKEKHREKTHRKRANGILRYVFYAMLLSAQALPGNGFYGQVQPGLQNVYQGGGGGSGGYCPPVGYPPGAGYGASVPHYGTNQWSQGYGLDQKYGDGGHPAQAGGRGRGGGTRGGRGAMAQSHPGAPGAGLQQAERNLDVSRQAHQRGLDAATSLAPRGDTGKAASVPTASVPSGASARRNLQREMGSFTGPEREERAEGAAGQRLIELSAPENDVAFKAGHITNSLLLTARMVGVTDAGDCVPTMDRGPKGPFRVVVSQELAARLVEDGETEISVETEGEELESVTFVVYPLDKFGKRQDEESLNKARARTLERGERGGGGDRDRTTLFFLTGNDEMALEGVTSEYWKLAMQQAVQMVEAECEACERSNWCQTLDPEFRRAQNEAQLFVVRPEGMTAEAFYKTVHWDKIKYLVVPSSPAPIKVRIKREVTLEAGIKACCFQPACDTDPKGYCTARSKAFRGVPSGLNHAWRAEKSEMKKARELQASMKREAALGEEAEERRRVRAKKKNCSHWMLGKCRYLDPDRRPCQYGHPAFDDGTNPNCNLGDACMGEGTCPYNHG